MCEASIPDSMPPLDRRWLLVARSADFADVGPTLGRRLPANPNSGYMSIHFADGFADTSNFFPVIKPRIWHV